jgi:hypothetical protein
LGDGDKECKKIFASNYNYVPRTQRSA